MPSALPPPPAAKVESSPPKLAARLAAAATGPWSLGLLGAGRGAAVLLYHRVVDERSPLVDLSQRPVSASELHRQISHLLRYRRPVALDALITQRLFADPVFAVTFDDGYADVKRLALPVLGELGVPATAFVTTDAVAGRRTLSWDRLTRALGIARDRRLRLDDRWPALTSPRALWSLHRLLMADLKRSTNGDQVLDRLESRLGVSGPVPAGLYLSWSDAATLVRQGWSVGAHTASHPCLTVVTRQHAMAEIDSSAEEIEAELGTRPRLFAYPFGTRNDFSVELAAALAGRGFIGAVTVEAGLCSGDTDPFAVPRIAPRGGESWAHFLLRASGIGKRPRGLAKS